MCTRISSAPLRSGSIELEDRRAARVIVVDPAGRTLLFRGGDPHRPQDGTWWFTPGGGVEPGESVEGAARRELLEETGIEVGELGPPVRRDHVELPFMGRLLRQHQTFFRVRVHAPLDVSGWTEWERRTVAEYRWWTADELRTTGETVYPADLVTLVQ